MLLPGLLVAATGVGAGDLITASLAGSELGTTLLWAAALGALLKAALNEGLARWQLATGTTLLEGWAAHLPIALGWAFGLYLLLWSFVVGGALISACGMAGSALLPIGDAQTGRVVWGVAHSLVGLAIVRRGGFALFERIMAACIVVMVLCVTFTAAWLAPPVAELAAGFVPSVPAGGLGWTLGVLGGVGGTVTLLSYGYWIREHGRDSPRHLKTCRIDLGVAYAITALFGMAMLVIGSRLQLSGQGAGVALALADQLESVLGPAGRWLFLVGFWGAVFSSLLGVWQSVPILFSDWWRLWRVPSAGRTAPPERPAAGSIDPVARRFQIALALIPLGLLGGSIVTVQLAYAVFGALFMPFLAATLLWMCGRRLWVGDAYRNRWVSISLLTLTVAFFVWQGVAKTLTTG
jgi:Mn2+/Fe2+ NRAMP family transporter